MSDVKIAYAASSNLTVTALNGLALSATHVTGWESAEIDNSSNKYVDMLVSAKITVESAGLAAGQIRIHIVPKLDDSTWPGGFDGTESAETTPLDDENGTAIGAIIGGDCSDGYHRLTGLLLQTFFGGSVVRRRAA